MVTLRCCLATDPTQVLPKTTMPSEYLCQSKGDISTACQPGLKVWEYRTNSALASDSFLLKTHPPNGDGLLARSYMYLPIIN
ncbi:jg21976 [Pararge aegeria aegeria]|uniref:Jg21976 protein n=1 Tax=Pararge aegeria aegeria TaxID=348720 RepID=A0A8S4RWR9_9NEOP|nr:jg21976 [Pararge aegeria aegeria]